MPRRNHLFAIDEMTLTLPERFAEGIAAMPLAAEDGSRVVDLLFIDGTVLEEILVDRHRCMIGRIVGGHDGVQELEDSFPVERIKAIRPSKKLFGIIPKKWSQS